MVESIMIKKCGHCGVEKSLSSFSKNRRTKDGLQGSCKACDSISNAKSAAMNKDRKKAYGIEQRTAHPEKFRARRAAFYIANCEYIKAVSIAWRKANPEARRIQAKNRHAKKLEIGGKLGKDLTAKLFKLQRGKCPCCNEPLGKDFHLDHKMPLTLGGPNTDDNIQLLRATCNQQKHAVDFMQSRGFLL